MTENEVMGIIASTIEDTFMVDASEVTRETVAIDIPGWDSLSHIILLSNIEEKIVREIQLEEADFENVGELVDFIHNKLAFSYLGL